MPDIESLKKLIRRWYSRSKPGTFPIDNPFDNFVCLWMAFNAWGCHVTGIDSHDRLMINELKTNTKLLDSFAALLQDSAFRGKVRERVGRNHEIPTHRTPAYVWIDHEDSFEEVLEFIYTIRCNLFHGRKDPEEPEEQQRVKWATSVLDPIFNKVMDSPNFLTE